MKKRITIEDSCQARTLVAICDLTVIFLCYMFSHWLVPDILSEANRSRDLLLLAVAYVGLVLLFPPLVIRPETTGPRIVSRSLSTVFFHFFASAGLYALAQYWLGEWHWLLAFWGTMAVLLTAERLFLRALVKNLWRSKDYSKSVVLVGDSFQLTSLCQYLSRPKSGFQVKGIFCNADSMANTPLHLGTAEQVNTYLVQQDDVEAVYCLAGELTAKQHKELFDICLTRGITYYAVPEFLHAQQRSIEQLQLAGIPLVTPASQPLDYWLYRWLKRLTDILFSLLFLATVFPFIYVVIALVIKRQSVGPVFCTRTYNGRKGKKCRGLFFRTSYKNDRGAESVFPFGERLRRRHLDEIPLIFQVLKGKMSLVGPRYHVKNNIEAYRNETDDYQICKRLAPGLTGCSYSSTSGNVIADDIAYARDWNLWLDLRLILHMLAVALRWMPHNFSNNQPTSDAVPLHAEGHTEPEP